MLEKRLIALRGSKTQQEVADGIGISRARYSHYENGRSEPDNDLLYKIAEYFDVTTDYLLGRPPVVINVPRQVTGDINAGGETRILLTQDKKQTPEQQILSAVADEPELLAFWQEQLKRKDLQLLFKQTAPLSPEAIQRVIRYIYMVENEEAAEDD